MKKKLYLYFERGDYISGKSSLLKLNMDVIYLKKKLKNFYFIRTQKKEMIFLLKNSIYQFYKSFESYNSLLPKLEEKEKSIIKNKLKKKKEEKLEEIDLKNKEKKDDIEKELLEIKKKLELLGVKI